MELGSSIALDVDGLSKSYGGGVAVVDDASFSIRQGSMVAFLGPNGAGKTTVMNMIAGLIKQEAGQISLFGQPSAPMPRYLRARLGYMQEKPRVYPEMTARGYLRFFADFYGVEKGAKRVDQLLDQFSLTHAADRTLNVFSRGMQQRVCLARVLLPEPDFLMLDEPTLGLDPVGISEMRDIFSELNSQGITLFFSSHQLAEMERVCDTVVLMHQGRVVASGPRADLGLEGIGRAGLVVEIAETAQEQVARILPLQKVESVIVEEKHKLRIVLNDNNSLSEQRAVISRIVTGLDLTVLSVNAGRLTLEDHFMSLTQNKVTT